MNSIFGSSGLESSNELVSFLTSSHSDTVDRGLVLLTHQARPLAWNRPIDEKTEMILASYIDSYPSIEHFLKFFDEGNEGVNLEYLFDSLKLLMCYMRISKKPLSVIISKILSNTKLLFRALHSSNQQLMANTLSMLTAIAKTGRSGADQVREAFDFSMKPLERILFNTRKLPSGDQDKSMWSLRQIYVDFILALIEYGSFETRECVAKLRSIFANIFQLLPKDHPIMVRRILLVLKQVILNETSGYSLAVAIFSATNVLSIIEINEKSGDWTEYLRDLLTIPGEGVCFMATGLDLKNRIALDLLPLMKPLESERQQDLAIDIIRACPDIVVPYLTKMKFNYEVDGSDRWTALMAFTVRILKIDDWNSSMLTAQVAKELCLLGFIPSRTIINKCLNSENLILKVYMITVLQELSNRMMRMLRFIENSSGECMVLRDEVVKDYLRVCPDIQTLLSAYDTISVLPSIEINNMIRVRMNMFMSIFLIFNQTDKLSVKKILSQARDSEKELAESCIQLASSLSFCEDIGYSDVEGIKWSLVPFLFNYISRNCVFNNPARADRVAAWADNNRREFFDRVGKQAPLGEMDVQLGVETLPIVEKKARAKRRRTEEPDDLTPKAIFAFLGREQVFKLIRVAPLASNPVPPVELRHLSELENCTDLVPWLRIIASGLMKMHLIDGSFCSLQLPVVIMSMAAENADTRKIAYSLMDRIYQALTTESEQCRQFKERRQVRLLLDVLRNSTDEYCAPQSLPRVAFASLAAPILAQPHHPMYPIINSLLLSKPVLPTAGIPFFDAFMESKLACKSCFKFVCRLRDCIEPRACLPEWQSSRLKIVEMLI